MPFERELSCLAVRARDGEMRFYPVVANVHRDGILRVSTPQAADPLQAQAEDYARRVAEHLNYVGVLAFEFFVAGGALYANEIAPRVHNSGHWTIEGAATSGIAVAIDLEQRVAGAVAGGAGSSSRDGGPGDRGRAGLP